MHVPIPNLDLAAYAERDVLTPFHDLLLTLHDEEHQSGSPDVLPCFRELVEDDDRSPEVDAALVPWLLRYIWQTPCAAYTQHGWRALQSIVADPESLADHALQVFLHHPHGLARAEVIAISGGGNPAYTEEPAFLEAVLHAAQTDPSPTVRAASWAFLRYQDALGKEHLPLLCAGLFDLATEVRVEVSDGLRELYLREDAEAQQARRDAQEAALQDPTNGWILHRLLLDYLRSVPIHSDPHRAAFALDLVAGLPAGTPFRTELIEAARWQVPWPRAGRDGTPYWLTLTPFGSGPALLDTLERVARDPEAPPASRAAALQTLYAFGEVRRIDLQEALDLLLDTPFGAEDLSTLLSTTTLVRAWFAWPNPPVRQASNRVELLKLLADRAHAVGASDGVRFLADEALRLVRHPTMGAVHGQPLFDAAVEAVANDEGDPSFGLYDLKSVPAGIDFGRLPTVLAAASPETRRSVGEYVAGAFAAVPSDDRFQAVIWSLEQIDVAWDLVGVVRQLPAAATLPDVQRVRLERVFRDLLMRLEPDDWVRSQVEDWLRSA